MYGIRISQTSYGLRIYFRREIVPEKAGSSCSLPPPPSLKPLALARYRPYATMSSVELYASAIQEFLQTTTESPCSAIGQAFGQLVPPELRFQVALHILWPSMQSGKRLVSWRQGPHPWAKSESGRDCNGGLSECDPSYLSLLVITIIYNTL
jgi:hypothetical protein